jgi:pimeloyl-ACP methyl ester carboxylesterase
VDVLFPRDEAGIRRLVAAIRHKPPATPSFLVRDILARRLREEWIIRRALESMGAGRDWLNATLGRAEMPVLIVWGRQDRLIPVAYAAPLQAEFPHAALKVLDGCGHVPMADCPEAFDRELLAFLAAEAVPAAH